MPLAFAIRNSRVRAAQSLGVTKPHAMKANDLDQAITDAMLVTTVVTAGVSTYVGKHRSI